MTETVNHPKHYQHASGIECWQLSAYMPHPLASALEYVWRYENKNGVEDLKKARWWLQCWLNGLDIPQSSQSNKFKYRRGLMLQAELNLDKFELMMLITEAADKDVCTPTGAISRIKRAIDVLNKLIIECAA